jgi:hypothetical protein
MLAGILLVLCIISFQLAYIAGCLREFARKAAHSSAIHTCEIAETRRVLLEQLKALVAHTGELPK